MGVRVDLPMMILMGKSRRAALLLAGALLAGPSAALAAPPAFSGSAAGIEVVSSKALSPRLFTVKVKTSALPQPVDVRILVPEGYDQASTRRYPVLYLFHGTSGRAADWTTTGDAERTTAGAPMIVVMPDAGFDGNGGGWFVDYFNGGAFGLPKWETFHMGQLVPWVDRTLRTIPERRGRAIYGLSQGGFGSMSYASRHPDLFLAAGAFSGAVTTTADLEAQLLTTPIVQATSFGLNGGDDPDAMFGPRATQQINWAAHDPGMLVENLRGMDLRFYTRNGQPGPLDGPEPNPGGMAIEGGVHELNTLFHARLQRAGIPHTYRDEGPGLHSWAYWSRDLRDVVPVLVQRFAAPRATPARVSYTSADPTWSAWGWTVQMERPAREFSTLGDADDQGFALSGSGAAKVLTPGVYEPGTKAAVTVVSATVDRTLDVVADRDGRLTIEVPLGPGNPSQAMTPEADLAGTKVFTTHATIAGVARIARCAQRTFRVRLPASSRRTGRTDAISVGGVRAVRVTVDGRTRRASVRGRVVTVRLPADLRADRAHRIVVTATARTAAGRTRALRETRTLRCR
jgi:S-formylglutathione hydrolase FrmB